MYKISDKPQVAYTLDCLSDSLFGLLEKKPLEEITVVELCRRAQIVRKSFYRNCGDKLDLVDYAIDSRVLTLFAAVDWECTDPHRMYHNFFEYWLRHRRFLAVTCKRGLFPRFSQRFAQLGINKTSYAFLDDFVANKNNAIPLRIFHHSFLIGGLCQMLQFWAAEGFVTSVDELVSVVEYLQPQETVGNENGK